MADSPARNTRSRAQGQVEGKVRHYRSQSCANVQQDQITKNSKRTPSTSPVIERRARHESRDFIQQGKVSDLRNKLENNSIESIKLDGMLVKRKSHIDSLNEVQCRLFEGDATIEEDNEIRTAGGVIIGTADQTTPATRDNTKYCWFIKFEFWHKGVLQSEESKW